MASTLSGKNSWAVELRDALGVEVVRVNGASEPDKKKESFSGVTAMSDNSILDALGEAAGNGKDPEALFHYCKALGDVLKVHDATSTDPFIYVRFGTKRVFGSMGHLRDYILDQCRTLFEKDPISLKYNLGVASLWLHGVPHWARSFRFTKMCIDRALIFHPESSKALTKMGLFSLHVEKNLPYARACFKQAWTNHCEDFVALTCHLYSMFECIHKRTTDRMYIQNLIKTEIANTSWTPEERSVLYFIRGLYQFFSAYADKNVAVSWIRALEESEVEIWTCLEKFRRIKETYKFPEAYSKVFTNLNFHEVLKAVRHCGVGVDQEKLQELRNMIKIIGRKELQVQQQGTLVNISQDEDKALALMQSAKKALSTIPDSLGHAIFGVPRNADQALKTFGIPKGAPWHLIRDVYKKRCRELEAIRKEAHDVEEIDSKAFNLNVAFATLYFGYEKMAPTIIEEDAEKFCVDAVD